MYIEFVSVKYQGSQSLFPFESAAQPELTSLNDVQLAPPELLVHWRKHVLPDQSSERLAMCIWRDA